MVTTPSDSKAPTTSGMAPLGTTVTFAKTISESDVYLYAGITGDIGPNHTNAEYMSGTRFGQRVAHGALTLGLMSTCSTRLIEMLGDTPTVNYGYDRVRFTPYSSATPSRSPMPSKRRMTKNTRCVQRSPPLIKTGKLWQ
jgi:hypothetical protein